MKKFTLVIIVLACAPLLAQVGVNTTAPNAMLEVNSNTNGFLIPRIALTASNVQAPVVNPQGGPLAVSTMIYNTATVAGANGVQPGFYYWDGVRWVGLAEGINRDWNLTGNAGTTSPPIPAIYGTTPIPGTANFLGTTDSRDLVFGTNLIERMRIDRTVGNVGIGTANPQHKLDILTPGNALGLRILSGNAAQYSYLSLGRDVEFAQIGAATAGSFFIDAANGDMAIKNFNSGKLLFGASYIDNADMAIVPGGNVGINTSSPLSLFDIRSTNVWNTTATEGDFRIGDLTNRFKIGVATGGAGAGDIRLTAEGGTNRLFLGSAAFPTLTTIDGLNNRVGIKNVLLPNSVLDVNGDLALREGTALALANSATPAVALPAGNEYSHYRITGPTVPFSLSTITGGNDGQVLTLINATGQRMGITNTAAANGILTGSGNNLSSMAGGNASVTMIYNATLARWVVTSSSGMEDSRFAWEVDGNADTNDPAIPATYGTTPIATNENWIGTTDANDIVLGTNNIERMRIKQSNGYVGIGTANPGYQFHTISNELGATVTASQNLSIGNMNGIAVLGNSQNNPGYGIGGYFQGGNSGIRAYNSGTTSTGNTYAGYFSSTGTAGYRYGVVASASGGTTNYGGYFDAFGGTNNYSLIALGGNTGIGTTVPTRAKLQVQGAVGNTVAMFNSNANSIGMAMVSDWPGIYFNSYYNGGTRQMSSGNYPAIINYNPGGQFEFSMSNTANTVAGNLAGGIFSNRFLIHRDLGAGFHYTNTAITALTASSGGLYPDLGWFSTTAVAELNAGRGVSGAGQSIGIEGRANHFNTASSDKLGGVFYVSGYNGGAIWGIPAAAVVGSVVDNVVYKVFGFGIVSTIVKDTEEKDRIMVAPESPEALFQDYGTAQLVNGHAKIEIDPILAKNIRVDETHPLKVFIQLEGDCNGVYVFNKTATSFEVKELQSGTSSVPFSYQIVAFRADEERSGIVSQYSDMRFKPMKAKLVEDKREYDTVSKPDMAVVNEEPSPSGQVPEPTREKSTDTQP